MIRKAKIILYWAKNEPGWLLVLGAIIFSLSLGLVGAYLSPPWGYLAFMGGICSGSLTSAACAMADRADEINNTPFPKDQEED